jgi:kynurenine formamidase
MMATQARRLAVAGLALGLGLALGQSVGTQQAQAPTRERGPWWPSPHGANDQAGNTNYITPEKVLQAVQLVKTGRMYELGQIYEEAMPQFGLRPYHHAITSTNPPRPVKEGTGIAHQEYFTGYIGQMGTQYDAFGHMGQATRMADGSLQWVFYNGFTEEELVGRTRGFGGLQALGIDTVRPIVTRGVLIDIAGFKGVAALEPKYEVTLADVRGALARQNLREESIGRGDAVVFNYGWSTYWTNASKYNPDGRADAGDPYEGVPGIGMEVARWLAPRGVAMVGADSCCVMIMPPGPGGSVHHELMFSGVVLLENMELRELARDRVYEFLYVGPPLRIRGATGSPARPIAIR